MEIAIKILELGKEFLAVLATMSPWLLLGFAVAGILHVVIPTGFVMRHLSGRGFSSVLKASLLGVPLPLCSCGVIPVAASLRGRGASSGATASFLISTPQTGVDSMLVTWSLMGPIFMVFRVFAAFVSGLAGGAMVDLLAYRQAPAAGDSFDTGRVEKARNAPSGGGLAGAWRRGLRHALVTLPTDLAPSLTLGLLIAALITVLVPPRLLAELPGGYLVTMAAMLLLGLPIYVCATASVPIGAALMLTQGVSAGAALVFLMTGPATNMATILTIRRMMGARAVAVYLAAVMLTALAAGLGLDALAAAYKINPASAVSSHAIHGVTLLEIASAVLLAALLLRPLAAFVLKAAPGAAAGAETAGIAPLEFTVRGMHCGNCRAAVEAALKADPQVAAVSVDLASGRAVARPAGGVESTAAELAARLVERVEAAGYSAEWLAPDAGEGDCPTCRNEG